MIQITPQMRLLVAIEPVDFRKGIDGLAGVCRQVLNAEPLSGAVFVFRNRRQTALKILVYDGQGFWLCQKRLSRGQFRWWPDKGEGSTCRVLAHELQTLIWNGSAASVEDGSDVAAACGGKIKQEKACVPSYGLCSVDFMEIRYRGRTVSESEIAFIRELIAKNPSLSRRQLSSELCRAWNWVQRNGELKDMVCRGLMLLLHRQGQIELPAKRRETHNPLANRSKPSLDEEALDTSPLECRLSELQPIDFRQVRRKGSEESLFNGLIERYHYLGYTQPVGEHLKYLVYGGGRPVACFAFSSAPRHLGPRDRFIGWTPELRRQNVHLVAYNTRYLIFPWVRVRYLASHLLSRVVKRLSSDWERMYHHPVHFIETFVNAPQYKGTCYLAANWVYLGKTTGRGKDDLTHRANRPVKKVLGYPLVKRFREKLCEVKP